MLTTYMTSKPNDFEHDTATAWYDNLVIANNPIMDGIDLPPDPSWPPE